MSFKRIESGRKESICYRVQIDFFCLCQLWSQFLLLSWNMENCQSIFPEDIVKSMHALSSNPSVKLFSTFWKTSLPLPSYCLIPALSECLWTREVALSCAGPLVQCFLLWLVAVLQGLGQKVCLISSYLTLYLEMPETELGTFSMQSLCLKH